METLAAAITAVRERIAAAARRAGRSAEPIRLVGVSKTHPPELVRAALAAGLTDFGENRVQEAEAKIAALAAERQQIAWHLIGHLQTNKARKAAALFDCIHSVDSLHLAEAMSKVQASTANSEPRPPTPILLQVNVSGEAGKEGFDLAHWEERPEALDTFLVAAAQIVALPGLRVRGLMTIAPWNPTPEAARPTFRSTRRLRDLLAQRVPAADWSELSMGMTDDFEIAVEEGATLLRVGRAIFGAREQAPG
jgi:pyridoxal phosphate enzyme (YggS family)